jgi:hypothetical protein
VDAEPTSEASMINMWSQPTGHRPTDELLCIKI